MATKTRRTTNTKRTHKATKTRKTARKSWTKSNTKARKTKKASKTWTKTSKRTTRKNRNKSWTKFNTKTNRKTATKTNPLGTKGAGEAGTVGAMPAVANALVDALSEFGVKHIAMPATPETIWRAIHRAS